MSVLIKGMKMPRGCDECDFVQHGIGDWCYITEQGLPCDCPLIELPNHGDLIEKMPIVDALAVAEKNVSFLQRGVEREENIKYCQGVMVGYENSIFAIDNAPVVIPAERSEDERTCD